MPPTDDDARWPQHVSLLRQNLRDVGGLLTIHSVLTGSGFGRRPPEAEVLNKSGLVLLCACWEAYIEELARTAFDFMLSHVDDPDRIPARVLVAASSSLRSSSDEREVWKLAGSGWRRVMRGHRDEMLAQCIGRMHTPRPDNIDHLFDSLIGYRSLSAAWKWKGMSNSRVLTYLNELITLRGEIAHRVTASGYVRKRQVEKGVGFIQRLAAISSNRVRWHLRTVAGQVPWTSVSFGHVR
jgi:hypothetical protein